MDVIGASSNIEAHEAAYQIYVNPSKAVRIDVFERYDNNSAFSDPPEIEL